MHNYFYSFKASNHYDLGFQMGKQFKTEAHLALNNQHSKWEQRKQTAQAMIGLAEKIFPDYIQELHGYSDGAEMDWLDFWTLSIEDDAFIQEDENHEKCTTLVTNSGKLVAQTEDSYEPGHKDDICIVKKEINEFVTLELFYYNTIGGTSIGINSAGFVQSINTLLFTPKQIGIPKQLLSRLLLDTTNPDRDISYIRSLTRASGFNHTIVNKNGEMWNVELTITSANESKPILPFSHTNHCLLSNNYPGHDEAGTVTRFITSKNQLKPTMSESEIISLLNNDSQGSTSSIMNERTIGKLIVNFETLNAKIWLLREIEKGWVDYPLNFLGTMNKFED